jgi:hypothetical protein
MLRPGANPEDVRMSDVLCDFCRSPWSSTRPMIEGHRGSVICGHCLAVACAAITGEGGDAAADDYFCIMCRENAADRTALDRADETGWRSPAHTEAVICRRCIEQAAGALEKDPDHDWRRPAAD